MKIMFLVLSIFVSSVYAESQDFRYTPEYYQQQQYSNCIYTANQNNELYYRLCNGLSESGYDRCIERADNRYENEIRYCKSLL